MATFDRRTSDVIKWTASPTMEHEIDVVNVAVTADTKIGDVLYDNAGTFELVAVANTAAAEAVLVDEKLRFGIDEVGGVGTVALRVVRRTANIVDEYLNYAADVDTQNEKDAVNAVLLSKGLKVVKGY